MHSVVFAGFSAESLAARIVDAKCRILITADGVFRGSKHVDLKGISDAAVVFASNENVKVESVIVVEHHKRVALPEGATLPQVDIFIKKFIFFSLLFLLQ